MTTAPKCGSRRAPTMTSASPWTIGWTEKPSSPASSPAAREGVEHRAGGGAHRVGAGQAQPHGAHVALVDDPARDAP